MDEMDQLRGSGGCGMHAMLFGHCMLMIRMIELVVGCGGEYEGSTLWFD